MAKKSEEGEIQRAAIELQIIEQQIGQFEEQFNQIENKRAEVERLEISFDDLKKAKEVLGGKVCVAGNVSPTGVFFSGTPKEVISEGKACVEAWGEGGGYVLASGCDFPKDVPFENIQALMSLKEN